MDTVARERERVLRYLDRVARGAPHGAQRARPAGSSKPPTRETTAGRRPVQCAQVGSVHPRGSGRRPEVWAPAIHTIQGEADGPTVAVLGGVHGDEYEGVLAAAFLCRTIDPAVLRGRLLVIPVANPPAFEAGARESPLDGRNLARTFPGSATGSPTERTAALLTERAIHPADFLIDLHSAGRHYAMPLLCGSYCGPNDVGRRSVAAALAFGAPVLWVHPTVATGRSLSVAVAAGVPCIYAECGGGGRIRAPDIAAYASGVRRVLAHLGLLPQKSPHRNRAPRLVLRSHGDVDEAIPVRCGGLLVARVKPLDLVVAGQPLADVFSPHDATPLETVCADRDGVVVLARRTACVAAGEGAFLIAQPDKDPPPALGKGNPYH